MQSIVAADFDGNDFLVLALTISVAMSILLAACIAYTYWQRWEKRNLKKGVFQALVESSREDNDLYLTGSDGVASGELIAQFKVNQGKQVVSVVESEGRRFIHVAGDLSPDERSRMMHYLKSEGFMS